MAGNKPELDPSSSWETQMLQATRIAHDVAAILADDYPTVKMFREFVMKVFQPGDVSDSMFAYIGELDSSDMEPWQEPGFVDMFRDVAARQYQLYRESQPNLTGVGLTSFAGNKERMPRSLMVDELFVIGCLPGGTGVIYGPPGTGKSNLAIGEIYRTAIDHENWEVDVNIPIEDIAPNARFNGTLSGTLLHGAEFARQMTIDGHKDFMMMWINDEAQFSRDRQRSGSNENIAMKQINLVARMFGFYQWSILQQNKAPSEVKDFATHFIEKPSRSYPATANLRVAGKYVFDVKLSNIPSAEERGLIYEDMTKLTYKVDINPLRLFDYISGLADKTGRINTLAQYDAVIEYIEKHRGEKLDIISDDIIGTILFRARKRLLGRMPKEVSYRRLGMLVGWDEKKCERRVKKAEEDERDGLIVPDDTDDMLQDLIGAVDVGQDDESGVGQPTDDTLPQ